MGEDAFPLGVGPAGHRNLAAVVIAHDGVPVFEVGQPDLVDVVGRTQAFQLNGLGVSVRDREFLGRLEQGEIVCEEEGGRTLPVAAVLPCDGQKRHVLREFLIGNALGGVQGPLRSHEGRGAEQAHKIN